MEKGNLPKSDLNLPEQGILSKEITQWTLRLMLMKHRWRMEKLIVHPVLRFWQAEVKVLIGWKTAVSVLGEIVKRFVQASRGNLWSERGERD